jgi:hypothetical protein
VNHGIYLPTHGYFVIFVLLIINLHNMNRNFRPFALLLFLSLFLSPGFSQKYEYPENKGAEGFRLISAQPSKIELDFSVHQFEIMDRVIDGETMKSINYGLSLNPGEAGYPELPYLSKTLLIPNGSTATIVIKTDETETISNLMLAPAAAIPFDIEVSQPATKGAQYEKNELFPLLPVQSKTFELRGMQMLQIGLSPFQFNAATGEMVVHKNLSIEIQISGGDNSYGDIRFRSHAWDQILDDLVLNNQNIPKINYSKIERSSKDYGCEYLIVIPDHEDFLPWADSIKKFRNEQGILTRVMTLSEIGGNDIQILKNFFTDVYNTWNPVPSAVLMMADYGTEDAGITSISFTHPYEGTYITDQYYADVNGNNLPEFVFARLTGNNAEELELLVRKFIDYERTPPTSESFYNSPITALGWQTERWFQICSETVGGYMKNVLGKTPVRVNAIYEGNPDVDPWSSASGTSTVLNYFGPNGLNYIPATPNELGEWTGGTAANIVGAINNGAFILQHRDHGYYGGWGEPAFNSNHIEDLTNVGQLSHVFSINCQTGQFDVGTGSFGENFHRLQNGGALSVTAPTQVSYSFVNDALVWGIYDNMWPDFMPDYGGNQIPERDFRPAFGLASGKYFLSTTSWADNSMKLITYRLFHHFGDAYNVVYTEVPQTNPVAHEFGLTSDITSVDVYAENGSMVGLSLDEEYITSGLVNDGFVTLSFPMQEPGNEFKVVVTKQNYFRYEGKILIVPAEGSYVMTTAHSFTETNNNGIIEFNEEVTLDFTIKNIGNETAENVVISILSSDPNMEITQGEYAVGQILAGDEIVIPSVFSFSTSLNIPDLHQLDFTFSATDGNMVWSSPFSFVVLAPRLQYSLISFDETVGNGNGYLEPGETANANYTITNVGHANFPEGVCSVSSNSSYVSIDANNQNFTELAPGIGFSMIFEITAEDGVPVPTNVSLTNTIEAAPFSMQHDLYFTMGLIVEDWESQTMNQFPWQTSGDLEWHLASDYVAEGDYSLKSGDIDHNQSSVLELNYMVLSDNQISFYVQISSQDEFDFLHFYIDDEIVYSWSGLVLFEQFTFPVMDGSHTFKWEYVKDASANSGLDAAWLDYILFPPGETILTNHEFDGSDRSKLVRLFPNPANQSFWIEKNYGRDDRIKIQIINSLGQVLMESELVEERLNVSSPVSGVYFIKAENTTGETQVSKMIIE